MSIDYSANFGIGMQIEVPTNEDVQELNIGCEDWWDYLNKIVKGTDFDYIQYGSGYDDEGFKHCIILEDKYNKTLDLRPLKIKFDDFIAKSIISTIGDFGVVGGLDES